MSNEPNIPNLQDALQVMGMSKTPVDTRDPAAVALGCKGGRSRSEAKARAARENGRKGGRPKKQQR